MEEEGEKSQRGTVDNRTVDKMIWRKWFIHLILEIWFTPAVYDVKPSTEDEGEDAKEADVCNEIENKMNKWKMSIRLVHCNKTATY